MFQVLARQPLEELRRFTGMNAPSSLFSKGGRFSRKDPTGRLGFGLQVSPNGADARTKRHGVSGGSGKDAG